MVLVGFGRSWKGLEGFGRVWKGLGGFGRVWEGLGRSGTCAARYIVRTGTFCGLAHCADWHILRTDRCADRHMCGPAHVRIGTCADWHVCGLAHVRTGTCADCYYYDYYVYFYPNTPPRTARGHQSVIRLSCRIFFFAF